MSFLNFVRAALIGLLAALAVPALALETGSAAFTNQAMTIYAGPGAQYDTLGSVDGEIAVRVNRCTELWCEIEGRSFVSGWVSLEHLDFGAGPGGLGTIRPDFPAGGPGHVCFYEGANFSGSYACAESGTVVNDLLLFGVDNQISSIAVEGNVSVTVCRDRDLQSYCLRVVESQPTLGRYLANGISSYRVY